MKVSRSKAVCLLVVGALFVAACGDDDDATVATDARLAAVNLKANSQLPLSEADAECIVREFGAERAAKYGNFDSENALEGASDADGEAFFDALTKCTNGDPDPEPDPEPTPTPDPDPEPEPDPELDCVGSDEDLEGCVDPSLLDYITLNANGVDTDGAVASFGDDAETVIDLVTDYLGSPDFDTGDQPTSADCIVSGDEFRRVEWGDVNFLFVDGVFDYWMSSDPDQNTEAFIGDSTTVSILPGHTTVAELTDVLGEAVEIDEEPFGTVLFYIEDNFGTMFGFLSDTSPEGIVETVTAGTGCAE